MMAYFLNLFHKLNNQFIVFLPKSIKIDGIDFYHSRMDRFVALLCWKYGIIEKQELKLVLNYIKADTVFIDLGANMGIYTFRASKKIKSGKILAFEPDKKHFECLKKTKEKNDATNVTLYPFAVTNQNGTISFDNESMNGGDFRVNINHQGPVIDTIRLDDFLGSDFKVDVIKMDIQGAEYLALQGMKNILQNNKDVLIFCEFWPKGMRLLEIDPGHFISFIELLGFNVYSIGDKIKLVPANELNNLQQGGFSNFILTRKTIL